MFHLVEKARLFATAAHGATGQTRRYTGEPFILHPMRVVELVKTAKRTSFEQQAAAWLHDVVEDTLVDADLIRLEFGAHVARLVEALTNVQQQAGNRSKRFQMNLERLARADAEAQTIKLADIIDNVGSVARFDPGFARTYIPEKLKVISILERGDADLHRRAFEACHAALRQMTLSEAA